MKELEKDDINICLIGGTGRSGTTILHRIFSKHPKVNEFFPEWRFMIDPDGLIDFYNAFNDNWSPVHFDVRIKRLKKLLLDVRNTSFFRRGYLYFVRSTGIQELLPFKIDYRYAGRNVENYCQDYLEMVDELIDELTLFKYRGSWIGQGIFDKKEISFGGPFSKKKLAKIMGGFYRDIIICVLTSQDVKYYVEDNTWNILWFDKILELLPEAKIVHIYRDPRDVVASYTKQVWAPNNPLESVHFYKKLMDTWWELREEIPEKSYFEVSLERLVADTNSTLRDICGFWNIEWHDNLTRTDLSKSNTGRWKIDFNREDQIMVQRELSIYIEKLGYMYEQI